LAGERGIERWADARDKFYPIASSEKAADEREEVDLTARRLRTVSAVIYEG